MIANWFFHDHESISIFSTKGSNFWTELDETILTSLNKNVFPLIKSVKHLSEFGDFLASGSLGDLFILIS